MERKTQIIRFKINSEKDCTRLLRMMARIEAIHWPAGELFLVGKHISKLPIVYIFLRVPSFQLTYSTNPEICSDSLPNLVMTVDSRQVLSMRLENENKFKICLLKK